MQRWRLIFEDGISGVRGAAADAFFASRSAGDPVLHLYTHRPGCAVLGRFQPAAVLHSDFCASHGITVARRATGGGALVLGPEQLCVSVALPAAAAAEFGDPYANLVTVLRRFARPLVSTLRLFAMPAEVVGRGDVTVADRLLAPIAYGAQPGGGYLLTYTLLVSLDAEVQAAALSQCLFGESATLADRITTVQTEIGATATVPFLRKGIAESYAATLGVDLEPGGIAREEEAAITGLALEHAAPACLAEPAVPAGAVVGALASDFGNFDIHVCRNQGVLGPVRIAGDFFATAPAVGAIEAGLAGLPAQAGPVQAALERIWQTTGGLPGILPTDLTLAVVSAALTPGG